MNLKALLAIALLLVAPAAQASERWTSAEANDWYGKQEQLTGANYVPSNAVNQLEMWQDATFDPARIEQELGWAERIGMNTMRVFLHDLLWEQDSAGFTRRISMFLQIAQRHHIRPMLVLFDSCWDPNPRLGEQPAPRPGVHNSRWVQSSGAGALTDPAQRPRLEAYVRGVVGAFSHDERVLAWDVWNEPDNRNEVSYGSLEPLNKVQLVEELLPLVFTWVRSANPVQPITSGLWHIPAPAQPLTRIEHIQIDNSDIVSFHNYDDAKSFEKEVELLEAYRRPILCTEYMARPRGSTFEAVLPVARKHNVAAINWGLVAGKTQTFLPWDSWQRPYVDRQPALWFHDIFRNDGSPYRSEEMEVFRTFVVRQHPR